MQSFMAEQICEISASSWFYYKEICYDARSHECKICSNVICVYISGSDHLLY